MLEPSLDPVYYVTNHMLNTASSNLDRSGPLREFRSPGKKEKEEALASEAIRKFSRSRN